ncbi:MAG: recombinase family protein [Methanomassiliicoccaceae archaeon]|nr:recombinase family protein [Methanomassiliicoccaceae archaeon]
MIRIAAYARVSTEDQATDGFSLGAQMDMLRAYAESQGDWEIYREYVDDGYSGRNDKRPEYTRMMSDIDNWDAIAVVKMDRIHRNSRNFMDMMDFLKKRGRDFISSTESLDTGTATGRFVIDMIQRIAQLESEQIGERTYDGMREKAESSNGVMGFTPPFGYSISEGELITNEEEIRTAKQIFRSYLSGMTVDGICYFLNKNGISTRRNNVWNKANMRNILRNPVYAGYMRWDDVFIRHNAECVVSENDFNEIQIRMASRNRTPGKKEVSVIKDSGPGLFSIT